MMEESVKPPITEEVRVEPAVDPRPTEVAPTPRRLSLEEANQRFNALVAKLKKPGQPEPFFGL